MVHHNDDAMNKIPLKNSAGLDDEEKNGGDIIQDTAAAEEARREQMRENILTWMKKLTIGVICFIGIGLILYVLFSLCFNDWSRPNSSAKNSKYNKNTIAPILESHINISNAISALPVAVSTSTISTSESTSTTIISTSTTTTTTTESTTTTEFVEPTALPVMESTQRSNNHDSKPTDSSKHSSKSPKVGVYQNAAVGSDQLVCSDIGGKILEVANGSAVDAAIASLLCNGLLSPHVTGIGGGLIMNVFVKEENKATTIVAREMASFHIEKVNYTKKVDGGLAIAVPGAVMGYYQAHARFGKLEWKKLVEPSLEICEKGFILTEHMRHSLLNRFEQIKNDDIFRAMFLSENEELLAVGSEIKIPKQLCESYKLLAENGPLDFYNGTLASFIAQDLKELKSIVSHFDLSAYLADEFSSITMNLGDDILYTSPPVSSSVIVAYILGILENFNMTKDDLKEPEKLALTIHRIAEAMKFGYAKRAEIGDMRAVDIRDLVSDLTNPDYAATFYQKLNDSTVLKDREYAAQYLNDDDDKASSHLVVLAPNGDAVSASSSLSNYFGCGHVGKRTGIIFNSAMNDFTFNGGGGENNLDEPLSQTNFMSIQKRPVSSLAPLILTSQTGDVHMVIGGAGGSKLIGAIVQVIARVLWFQEDIKQSIDAHRFYNTLFPNVLAYEEGSLNEKVTSILQGKGHLLKTVAGNETIVHGIVRNKTAIYAYTDSRVEGGLAGF